MTASASLALSLALVVAGYAIAQRLERFERLRAFLDGLVLVTVAGLCFLFILPHAFAALGGWALVLAGAGFVLPTLAERWLHRHEGSGPPLLLLAALAALALHCMLDGAALAHGGHAHEHSDEEGGALALTLAILIHRLPVGLFLGSTVRSLAGPAWAFGATAVVVLSTGLGHWLHEGLELYAEGPAVGVLNALLAGGLLHVVVGHGSDAPQHLPQARRSAAAGALLGATLLLAAPMRLPAPLRASCLLAFRLFCESSPAILLGFLGAGLLGLVPQQRLAALMTGRTSLGSALRGVVFGLPIPICSCGVVPLYRGLMRRGVPAAAAVAFLIATPELGLDSIFLSFPLLGWQVTVVRFLAAVALALVAGAAVAWLAPAEEAVPPPPSPAPSAPGAAPSVAARVWSTFRESLDELGPWMLAGILVAGLIYPFLDRGLVAGISPALQVPLFCLISAPIYLCASSATPVASVLLSKGVALGAVLAFLLTGPATNVTTYGALRSFHDRRTTLKLLATILGATVALGVALNALPVPPTELPSTVAHGPHPAEALAAALFTLLLVGSLARQGPRGFLGRLGIGHTHAEHDHLDGLGSNHGHSHDHGHSHSHDHSHGHGHVCGHEAHEAHEAHEHERGRARGDVLSATPPSRSEELD